MRVVDSLEGQPQARRVCVVRTNCAPFRGPGTLRRRVLSGQFGLARCFGLDRNLRVYWAIPALFRLEGCLAPQIHFQSGACLSLSRSVLPRGFRVSSINHNILSWLRYDFHLIKSSRTVRLVPANSTSIHLLLLCWSVVVLTTDFPPRAEE
ncbi:hypothetical protein BDN72DRAFT_642350 [Pluteus cervinus]|uniref:Uncharacterized protein n=1 Tax=Pluteus cervinus TaxID=181527 RepID=A0ACD3AUE2_9AGAR|nr:hypothetical protein BDN72DRAFT_642350 [Pluteus cervinus]